MRPAAPVAWLDVAHVSSSYRPRLFVISSSEVLPEARLLRARLQDEADLVVWKDGVFTVGDLTLERLETELSPGRYNGAVIVAGKDDVVESRGATVLAPRDNVILELGMALSAFGRHRTFLVAEKGTENLKLPTDLLGWSTAAFSPGTAKTRMDSAADDIRAAISDISWASAPLPVIEGSQRILQMAAQQLASRCNITTGVGIHLWLAHRTDRGTVFRRSARARSSPKTQMFETFEEGRGLVGYAGQNETPVAVNFDLATYKSAKNKSWSSLPKDIRLGMDFDLVKKSRQRYSYVKALPMFSSTAPRQVLGVLSVNLALGATAQIDLLEGDPGDDIIERTAAVLAHLLESHAVGMSPS